MDYPLPSTDPLGTDISIDQNGDLLISTSGSLLTATNEDNVSQAVRINIMTLPDLYLWGNDVGTYLAKYVDEPITVNREKEIQNIITEKLLQDTRIISVLGIDVDDSQTNTLMITIRAVVSSIGEVQIPMTIGGV